MVKIIPVLLLIQGMAFCLLGQSTQVTHGPLSDVLLEIEDITGWQFNFNPELIASISLNKTQEIDLTNQQTAITTLLESTALEFEIKNNVIILLPPTKRTYRICGNLTDKDEGEPLSFAHIYMDNYHGCLTNDNGYYEFSKEAYKNEQVTISYLGYIDQIIPIQKFNSGCQDVNLDKDVNIFSNEVVIRDYLISSISQHKEYAGINVNMNHAPREMGAIERDVLKTVQFLPGITSLDESASNITIRGSQSDQNLIVWEGAPVYDNGHFFGMISSINPFVVDQINVYKGVYNASYENRIGGVIDISLKNNIPDQLHMALGTTITESHAEFHAPIIKEKLGLVISGRKSTAALSDDNVTLEQYSRKIFDSSEILAANQDDDEEFLSNADFDYYDINAKVIYHPTSKLKFSSSYYRASNIFEHRYSFPLQSLTGYDSLDIQNYILSNKINYEWSNRSESELHVSHTKYKNEYQFLLDEELNTGSGLMRTNENEISDFQIKLAHRMNLNSVALAFGYIYDQKKVDYKISEFAQFEEDLEGQDSQVGNFHHVFFNTHVDLRGWLFEGGARASYLSQERSFALTPRLSIIKPINNNIKVKFSAGLFNQFVRQIENFSRSQLNIENKIWLLGTEDIMKSQKLSFGAIFHKNNWLLDIDAYVHRSKNVPVLSTSQQLAIDIQEDGRSAARGLEILVKRRWGKFNSALGYHFSKTNFTFPDFEDEHFPSNNDQRHNLSLLHQFQLKKFSMGMHYFFRSGLPYSEIDGIELMEEDDEEFYEAIIDEFNEERLPIQHRLDFSLGYRTKMFDKVNLDLQLSIFNLFNQKTTTGRSFTLSDIDIETEEPELFEVEKQQLGLTPQVLIRLFF